jgi:hypothetical protein
MSSYTGVAAETFAGPYPRLFGDDDGFDFTRDWFDPHAPHWERHIVPELAGGHQSCQWARACCNCFGRLSTHSSPPPPAAGRPVKLLEVGCWEGRSACWMLQRLAAHPASTLTCVDPFELLHPQFHANRLRFLRNTAATGAAAKLTLLQERSEAALPRLLAQGAAGTFDLAYVDGSHLRADVLLDGVLAWRLLKVMAVRGGVRLKRCARAPLSANIDAAGRWSWRAFARDDGTMQCTAAAQQQPSSSRPAASRWEVVVLVDRSGHLRA